MTESPGGVVHGYGLAASQLARLKSRGLRLTACVDKVAAIGVNCTAPHLVEELVGEIEVIEGMQQGIVERRSRAGLDAGEIDTDTARKALEL